MTNVPPAGGMPSEHSAFVPALSNRNDPKSARPSDLLSGRSPRPGSLAERSERVAKKVAALRRIRLPYPRQLAVMAEFDEVRAIGVEMRGLPQLGMTLFEVTGCGKTTAAQQYVERQQHAAAPGSTPTLLVRLDNSGTARALYVEILSALGDGFAMNGTEQNLRRRALDALGDAGTELVIIDESHHGGRRSGFGGEITSSVKLMLDAGVTTSIQPVSLRRWRLMRQKWTRAVTLTQGDGTVVFTASDFPPLVWKIGFDAFRLLQSHQGTSIIRLSMNSETCRSPCLAGICSKNLARVRREDHGKVGHPT